jgi:hypothetical protein
MGGNVSRYTCRHFRRDLYAENKRTPICVDPCIYWMITNWRHISSLPSRCHLWMYHWGFQYLGRVLDGNSLWSDPYTGIISSEINEISSILVVTARQFPIWTFSVSPIRKTTEPAISYKTSKMGFIASSLYSSRLYSLTLDILLLGSWNLQKYKAERPN